jgi:hypothetical protein
VPFLEGLQSNVIVLFVIFSSPVLLGNSNPSTTSNLKKDYINLSNSYSNIAYSIEE